MSGAADTRASLNTERHRYAPMARALVWEEFRVGGAVASVCAVVFALLVGSLRIEVGPNAWSSYANILRPFVLFAPLGLALLLILNPNNAGHLKGGFAQRILWLPVPVPVSVAVSLVMRALFLAGASVFLIGVTRLLYEHGPDYALILVFITLYLIMQTLDWARSAVSGLATALFVFVFGAWFLMLVEFEFRAVVDALYAIPELPVAILFPAALLVPIAAYGASVAAVHATRTGRRVGFPEFWEWPRYLDRKGAARRRPYSSAAAAQVGEELRRYAWILPAGTAVVTTLIALGIGVVERNFDSGYLLGVAGGAVLPILFFFSLVHGGAISVVQLRAPKGKPGYFFLLPASSEEMATSRCILNAIVLIPTLMAATALHMGTFTDIIPFALEHNLASLREVLWVAASRGILVGLAAWVLMGSGSKLLVAIVPGLMLYWTVLGYIDARLIGPAGHSILIWATWLPVPTILVGLFAWAWVRGLMRTQTLGFWLVVWLATAWLVHGVMPWYGADADWKFHEIALAALGPLAWGALVPAPFVLMLLAITGRRHGSARVRQDRAQTTRSTPRWAWAVVAPALLLALWMGWPAEPKYRATLRAEGAPFTPLEYDAYYPAVPDDENAALRYMAIAARNKELRDAFQEARAPSHEEWLRWAEDPDASPLAEDHVYGISGDSPTEPLDPKRLELTRAYWESVTATIAPELRAIAERGYGPSRYPIDLTALHHVELSHLAPIRQLARELTVEVFMASLEGDTERALASMEACITLSDSLALEPTLISQLARIAVLGISLYQVEIMLEFADLDDAEFTRLDTLLRGVLPPIEETRILDRAMRGERAMALSAVQSPLSLLESELDQDSPMAAVGTVGEFGIFLFHTGAERIVMTTTFAKMLDNSRKAAQVYPSPARWWEEGEELDEDLFWVAPLTLILTPALERAYGAEWRIRMQIDIARTAIAAERYRREHGHWPETLDTLVPAYIDAIPMDVHAKYGEVHPVRHAVHDGSFVVYSVGMSGRDDGGRARADTEERDTDDLTFVVGGRRE